MKENKNLKYARRLAVRWKKSEKKILEKLLNKGICFDEAHSILKHLETEGVLSDENSFSLEVFNLENKRYGFKRIKETLVEKGFPRNLIDDFKFDINIESENCDYYLQKGIKKYKGYRYFENEREKLINYLKRYGFNDKMILEKIKAGINYENVM